MTTDYRIGDELEPLQIWWTASGELVDFSIAHTYAAKLIAAGDSTGTNVFGTSKTTGFTGALGSGTKTNGDPNLTVVWATSGELNAVTDDGLYILQIVATRVFDSRERTLQTRLQMLTRF